MLVLVGASVFAPGSVIGMVKSIASTSSARELRGPLGVKAAREETQVEMVVEYVGTSETGYPSVVVLKEKDGEVRLPVWIGGREADAISVVLEGVEMPRPLTADLLCSVLEETGASVEYIVIDKLHLETFYAVMSLSTGWRHMAIDARPSDAIAIAVRVRAPIYVEKTILDRAGIRSAPPVPLPRSVQLGV